MQRQQSILSFLRKPSSGNQKPGGGDGGHSKPQPVPHFEAKPQNRNVVVAPSQPIAVVSDEIRGTDTPPEKIPRPIFAADYIADDDDNNSSKPSLFSSIMHKFVKPGKSATSSDRILSNNGLHTSISTSGISINLNGQQRNSIVSSHPRKETVSNANGTAHQGEKVCPVLIKSDEDVPGPETPGTRLLVPRLKRVREDNCKIEQKSDCSFLDTTKKAKFFQGSQAEHKSGKVIAEATSKFEWLDPSRIRDANRRRPDDPLYDKRTLYIPPDALQKMSASQKQYWSAKSQYMDVLLFFKVGKFYELYEIDAETGHKELDWKMTMSGVGKCRQVGISESGIEDAVQKLLARGYKVGRMEQLETSEQAKSRGSSSVIQRKLVHVLTPSTSIEGSIGPDAVHLLALMEGNYGQDNNSTGYGFAFVDCAVLKFWVGSISDDASCAVLGALLTQVSPKEIIYESRGLSKEAQKALKKYSLTGPGASQLTPAQIGADFIDSSAVRRHIQSKGYFNGSCNIWDHALEGAMYPDLALCALGGLTTHLSRLKLDDDLRNGDVLPYEVYKGCLRMDGQTLDNLEIFTNNTDNSSSGTLFKYLDNCVTSSGKRLLRKWICHPLKDVGEINRRLNVVEELMARSEIMVLVAQYLRKLPDLERCLGRIKATVQSSALILLPLIGNKLLKQRVKTFGLLVKGLRVGVDLLMLLQKEEHLISSLSNIVSLPLLSGSNGLDKFLTQFEAALASEFPNYQDHDIQDSDAERLSILIEIFIEKAAEWSQVIFAINSVDVLQSFASTSQFSSGVMSRPIVLPESKSSVPCQGSKGPTLQMRGLWHPFALGESRGQPVPNDIYLGENADGYHPRTLLLTGPNMGGKSTLLRATCLAVILAQLGCYVPCESCVLSLVDVVYTRLGATDRIMTGENGVAVVMKDSKYKKENSVICIRSLWVTRGALDGTFFIECTETASVLQSASQDSLVLLDELGRGTSTFDGYAIAYAVFRHLVEKVNCRLLFATHYHPLTKEFASHPHVSLQHMACTFKNSLQGDQDLVFLYRLASGACPESYGMQVALMAGIPKQIVEVASNAGQAMKRMIGESFKSSEQRSEFSTLHEEWLKTVLTMSKIGEGNCDGDDDVLDTLFCLWHELKCSKEKLGN